MSEYTCKVRANGVIDVIRTENAHKPHVDVIMWDHGGRTVATMPADSECLARLEGEYTVHPVVWVR